MITRSVFRWIVVLAVLLSILSPVASVAAQDDATPTADEVSNESVAAYRSETRLQRSLFGPESGTLVHDASAIALDPAGVSVRNFYARVRVTVPYDGEEQPWDAGITFRMNRDQSWRVVVNSDGTWFASLGGSLVVAEGELSELKTEVGEINELEVAVDGDTGYFALNREEAGSFELLRRSVPGDVAVGATFTDASTNVGAETEYTRFQIWELDDTGPHEPSAAGVALLEDGRDIADVDEPLAGPFSGSLEESSETIAAEQLGVEIADFYTRVELTNARGAEDHPFDFGLLFRDAGGEEQFRLIFGSDGTWFFTIGLNPIMAADAPSGVNTGAGDTNLLELVVSGDEAAFALNGDVVASLDVSDLDGPGDIAIGVGFYPGLDIVEGDTTAYADFAAWSLDSSGPSPTDEATDEPTEEVTEEPTEEVTEEPTEEVTEEPTEEVTEEPTEEVTEEPTEEVTEEPTEEVTEEPTEEVTEEPTEEVTEEPTDEPTEEPVDDETAYENYLDSTRSLSIEFGPESGDLVLEPDVLALSAAGVDLQDFILHAEFIAPYDPSEATWDAGFLFRFTEDDPHLRLIIVSTGDWVLSEGTSDPIQSGVVSNLRPAAGERNAIDLVVVGDTGYFGVNGEFVSALDLSSVTGSGDIAVGSSFFQGSFLEDSITGYEDFIIWPLESDEPDPTPEESATPDETETAEAESGSYTSPTFGYSVRYDEDEWEIEDESSEDGFDLVRFTNGTSTVDFQGIETDFTPAECLDDELEYYETADGFSNAEVALDADDNEMRGEFEDFEWAVFWFTYESGGESTDYTAYVECRPLDDGVLLKIVQFVPFDDFNDEIDARIALIDGLSIDGEVPDDVTATPDDSDPTETPDDVDPTEEPEETPESGETSVRLRLEEVDGSGIDGLVTIDADGDRSDVLVLVVGAEDGAVVLIQEGSCGDLSGRPEILLGDVEDGVSESNVRATVEELVEGGYSITVHSDIDDLTEPLACGEIAAG